MITICEICKSLHSKKREEMAVSITQAQFLSPCSLAHTSLPSSLNFQLAYNFSNCRSHSVISVNLRSPPYRSRQCHSFAVGSKLFTPEIFDRSVIVISETTSEEELWAAVCLRIRSFYKFQETFGINDHKRYLAEREFEALKDRIAGKTTGFKRVSCLNVTVPVSSISKFSELSAACKYSVNGEERVVVATLDLNQCVRLPEEIIGQKPENIGADLARAYLSNVCVAKELHRNGLGLVLVEKSKAIAENWGISDLYVHVAVDNDPAKHLYMKSGFTFESEEPAWEARFLDRPRRLLLWTAILNSGMFTFISYLFLIVIRLQK